MKSEDRRTIQHPLHSDTLTHQALLYCEPQRDQAGHPTGAPAQACKMSLDRFEGETMPQAQSLEHREESAQLPFTSYLPVVTFTLQGFNTALLANRVTQPTWQLLIPASPRPPPPHDRRCQQLRMTKITETT